MDVVDFSPVVKLWLQWHQTWNLVLIWLKVKEVVKTLLLLEAKKSDIFHTIEERI